MSLVTLRQFCEKHPKLGPDGVALILAGSVRPAEHRVGSSPLFDANLLETAARYRMLESTVEGPLRSSAPERAAQYAEAARKLGI